MRRRAILLALSALLVGACGRGGGGAAPEILYGEDICDRCRMVISERRHAAGASLEGRDYRFDDPGCLVEFLGSEPGRGAATAWVHDEGESWLAVEEAWFVVDPEQGTPMGSGILAFGAAETAASVAGSRTGAVMRWPDVAAGTAEGPQGAAGQAGGAD